MATRTLYVAVQTGTPNEGSVHTYDADTGVYDSELWHEDVPHQYCKNIVECVATGRIYLLVGQIGFSPNPDKVYVLEADGTPVTNFDLGYPRGYYQLYVTGNDEIYAISSIFSPANTYLEKYDGAGSLLDTWILDPGVGRINMGLLVASSVGGPIAYWTRGTPDVYRYDLTLDAALPIFATLPGNTRQLHAFLNPSAGQFLYVCGQPGTAVARGWTLDDAGALTSARGPFGGSTPGESYARSFNAWWLGNGFPVVIKTQCPVIPAPVPGIDAVEIVLTIDLSDDIVDIATFTDFAIAGPNVSGFCPTPPPPPGVTRYIRRSRTFALPFNKNLLIFVSRIEFLIQAGVGLTSGQGAHPLIQVRFSGNGGQTWGPQLTVPAGDIGDYLLRPTLNQIGKLQNGVCEIAVSDPVLWYFLDCFVDATSAKS